MGSNNDELKAIQKELKLLENKETLTAVIDNLKASLSIKDTIANMMKNQEDKEIIDWLGSCDTSANHNLACRKHEDTTGNWFFQTEAFMKWRDSMKSSLWLYGKPGSGKTILFSTIVEHITNMCYVTGDQFAYFYFDFRANWTIVDMLSSIIMQLCIGHKLPPELHHVYHRECLKGKRQSSQASLFKVLLSILKDSHRTFIMLDALDEYAAGRNRKDLLTIIKEMINSSSTYLNILITSRKEKDIEDEFRALIENTIALEESFINSDIALHIRKCLENDDSLRDWDDDTKNSIEKILCKKSHGMYIMPQNKSLMKIRFRWVECQLEALRDCMTAEDVMETLSMLPEDLDATYDRILSNIHPEKNRDRVKYVLKLITVAFRPLSLEEMSEALAVDCETEDVKDNRRLKNPSDILKICSNLIELSECVSSTSFLQILIYIF